MIENFLHVTHIGQGQGQLQQACQNNLRHDQLPHGEQVHVPLSEERNLQGTRQGAILVAAPVLSLADPVPGVVAHSTVLHEAVDHVVEGCVLVMGHLANVRAGWNPPLALFFL